MKSQVTTRRGDAGQTTSLSGARYSKGHPIMECVGTLDELRAHLALLRLEIAASGRPDAEALAGFTQWLMYLCFPLGSALSDPENTRAERHPTVLTAAHLDRLEQEQERLEKQTPLPHAFVIGATNTAAARADIACAVARRLERETVRLVEQVPACDAKSILAFLNRLSDFLFILARHLEDGDHITVDYGQLGP